MVLQADDQLRSLRSFGCSPLNATIVRQTNSAGKWRIRLLVLGLVFGSCSPKYLEDLKTPALIWERARGLCGSGLALDGDGQLWADEGGCEDGRPELSFRGRGASEKVDALRHAFDALPQSSSSDRSACRGNVDSFSKRASSGGFDSSVCASGTGADLSGLEEPYLAVAKSFLAQP